MFNFMLNAAEPLGLSEKLAIGGEVTLLGMGTVFAVLAILWALVEVLHLLLVGPEPKKKVTKIAEESTTPLAAPAPAPVAVSEPVTPAAPATDDLALIAVITAAIAAASGSSPSSFRVVSFKRANNKFSGK